MKLRLSYENFADCRRLLASGKTPLQVSQRNQVSLRTAQSIADGTHEYCGLSEIAVEQLRPSTLKEEGLEDRKRPRFATSGKLCREHMCKMPCLMCHLQQVGKQHEVE